MAPRRRPLDAITVRLEGPATPERVAQVTQMLAELARAAGADPASEDFTVVVTNLNMGSELRAWTEKSRTALDAIDRVASNPLDAMETLEQASDIAEKLSLWSRRMEGGPPVTIGRKGRRRRRRFDERFTNMMKAAAASPAVTQVRRSSYTTIESPILRVGRSTEFAEQSTVLVMIGGQPRPLKIEQADETAFATVMASRSLARVVAEAPVVRRADGSVDFDWKNGRAVDVQAFRPITGPEFLRAAKAVSPASIDRLLDSMSHDK